MEWSDWVLVSVGLYDNGHYLDKLCSDFCVDDVLDTDDEMQDAIKCVMQSSRPSLGNYIAETVFQRVIENAINDLGANEDDFNYNVNGNGDTWLRCKGKSVKCWDDIVEIYENNDKRLTIMDNKRLVFVVTYQWNRDGSGLEIDVFGDFKSAKEKYYGWIKVSKEDYLDVKEECIYDFEEDGDQLEWECTIYQSGKYSHENYIIKLAPKYVK